MATPIVALVLALTACRDKGAPTGIVDSQPATGLATGSGTGTATGTGTGATPCADPPLAAGRGGDASADARSGDPLFVEIEVPGLSDDVSTAGVAWVDLDRDGDRDALLTRIDRIELWRNDGCWNLVEVPLDLGGAVDAWLGGAMVSDLDRDGDLDLYLASLGEENQALLLLADGSWDRYVDRAVDYGVANPGTYSRGGAALGDVDGDGWLDLAIGGHQIGGAADLGRPLTHLFRFAPGLAGWSDGTYVDASPGGFGGALTAPCVPGAEATGMDTSLIDLDGDGALDLLWATHNDMFRTRADDPCATGANLYGLRAWIGDGAGGWVEQPEAPGSVTDTGRMTWSAPLGYYEPDPGGEAQGPETVTAFDYDNDGDRDLLAIGPTDPDWSVSSGQAVTGAPGQLARLLRNDGGVYVDATTDAGLDALNQTLGAWGAFFASPVPASSNVMAAVCALGSQEPLCTALAPSDRQPYPGHVLPLDADNDGWTDLLFVVRQCVYNLGEAGDDVRSVLLHNRGDGSFEALPTEISGAVGCGVAGFATDVDGDGWVDLHLLTRDDLQTLGTLADRVLWNRGAALHPSRHWTEVGLDGIGDDRALGARVLARGPSDEILATGWIERDAWRGSVEPVVHLGLGDHTAATVEVQLRDGTAVQAAATVDGPTRIAIP